MNNIEFAEKAKAVAGHKTLYVMGCFGAPLTGANVDRYCQNHVYNRQTVRTTRIWSKANQNPPVYGFDCVGLIKGILWGWNANPDKTYGGAGYACNGVPDIDADTMMDRCSDISTDFSRLMPGEAVGMKGHIGVYVGGGLAVECTPNWADGVQLTACNRDVPGHPRRNWTRHGKLPYINYTEEENDVKKFNTIEEVPSWAKPTIQKLVDAGALQGNEKGLDLSEDMTRILVILDRLGKL